MTSHRTYDPHPSNLAQRQWFQQARFGIFIHWGLYSLVGDVEWIMHTGKMSIADYEKLASQFTAEKFKAGDWVTLARRAGAKYITLTARHHDGFSLWDTGVSDWNVVKRSTLGRDVVREVADECHRQGIRLVLYYSLLDWYHPDYYPLGTTGQHSGRPPGGKFSRYVEYMHAQLSELLGGSYGQIAGIWFDGWWDQQLKQLQQKEAPPTATQVDWELQRTYELIHSLQPQCLIGNNHHLDPFPGEDYQMFEKDLPGHNTSGFNADSVIGRLPLETCDTINNSWGYNKSDHEYKTPEQLIHYLVRAAGKDANFLLNVGPRPDGTIQPEFVERLEILGQWLDINGRTIYGTRGGPVQSAPWGATTQTDDKCYIHLLEPPSNGLLDITVKPGSHFRSATARDIAVPIQQLGDRLQLNLADVEYDPYDTIIELV